MDSWVTVNDGGMLQYLFEYIIDVSQRGWVSCPIRLFYFLFAENTIYLFGFGIDGGRVDPQWRNKKDVKK